ncbi:MAG: hypothetical protein FJX46_17965 [Alphaproteobacteria bacterium]|nr:hypothetical protein [Alphaproteobacteria bacterium]
MFQSRKLAQFFATPIWLFDLDPAKVATLNAIIFAHLKTLTRPDYQPGDELSMQSPHDLHRRPEFAPLVEVARAACRSVFDELQVDVPEFDLTGCWINVSPPLKRHHEHTHPNNYLSLVYYPQVPKGGDSIRFHDPRLAPHVLMPRMKQMTLLTVNSVTVEVATGRLVAFPSWLRHSVEPNFGSAERISVAMNAMYRDVAERYSPPMWQPKMLPKNGS